jgi:hypothetical protein
MEDAQQPNGPCVSGGCVREIYGSMSVFFYCFFFLLSTVRYIAISLRKYSTLSPTRCQTSETTSICTVRTYGTATSQHPSLVRACNNHRRSQGLPCPLVTEDGPRTGRIGGQSHPPPATHPHRPIPISMATSALATSDALIS